MTQRFTGLAGELKRLALERKKLLAYVAGVAAALIALGLLHGQALVIAEVVVIVATGGGIHQAENLAIAAKPAARRAVHRAARAAKKKG